METQKLKNRCGKWHYRADVMNFITPLQLLLGLFCQGQNWLELLEPWNSWAISQKQKRKCQWIVVTVLSAVVLSSVVVHNNCIMICSVALIMLCNVSAGVVWKPIKQIRNIRNQCLETKVVIHLIWKAETKDFYDVSSLIFMHLMFKKPEICRPNCTRQRVFYTKCIG